MARLLVERIVLGPRREGHGYGVLATSEGLELPPAALDLLKDFNLRIGEYIQQARPIKAAFQFSFPPDRELWFVCETRHMGRIGSNPLIQTWGLVIARPQLEAVDYRLHALLAFNPVPNKPAKLGETLGTAAIETKAVKAANTGSPPPPDLLEEVIFLPAPLRLAVGGQLDAEAVLEDLLDKRGIAARAETSFITGPAPVFPWDLICYDREAWSDYTVADAISFDERGASGGGEPSEADRVWHRLRLALEPLDQSLAIALQRFVKPPPPDETAAGRVGRVVLAYLDRLPREHERAQVMVQLIEVSAGLTVDSDRRAAGLGLVRTIEGLFASGRAAGADLEEYVKLQKPLTEALGAPPLLLTRLAAEYGGALLVNAATIDRLDQSLVVNFAPEVEAAIATTSGALGTLAALLDHSVAADSRLPGPRRLKLALLDQVLARGPAVEARGDEDEALERAIRAIRAFVMLTPRTSRDIAETAVRKREIEELCGRHVSWNDWRDRLDTTGLKAIRTGHVGGGFFAFVAWHLGRHDLNGTSA